MGFSFAPLGLLGSCWIQSSLYWSLGGEWWVWNCMGSRASLYSMVHLERTKSTDIWGERDVYTKSQVSFLKTLFKWTTHSPTISTLSLMEFIDSLLLYCKSLLSFVSFYFSNLYILRVYAFPILINYNYLYKKKKTTRI